MLKRNTFFLLIIGSFFIFHNAFASTIVASQTTLGTSGFLIGSSFADGSGNEQMAVSRINFNSQTSFNQIKLYQIARDTGATTTGQYPLLIFDGNHTTVLATSTNMLNASNLPDYSAGQPYYDFTWTFAPFTASAGHTYYFGFQHRMPVLSGYIYILSLTTCGTGNTYSPAFGYDNGQYQWRTNCGGTANTDYPTTLGGLKYEISDSTPPPSITPSLPANPTANNPVIFSGAFFEPGPFLGSAFKLNLTSNGINNDGIGGYTTSINFSGSEWSFLFGLYSHSETLGTGYYTYNLSLINTISGTTSTTTNNINFRLTNSALATSTSATSTVPIVQSVATTTCTVWNALGCIQNALLNVFVPNLDIQRVNWQGLKENLSNKPPFGWIGMLSVDMGIIIAGTTTPAFTTIDLSALDPYLFNPLKLGMTIILWLGLLIHLYYRIKHIQL